MDIPRPDVAAALRAELTAPPPALTLLVGPPGTGKAQVVRDATAGLAAIRYWAAPLPDADHRALLAARLRAPGSDADPPADAPWSVLFDHLVARAQARREPVRLVLQSYPNLVEANPRLPAELARFWSAVRARGLPVHLVLAGDGGPALAALGAEGSPFAAWSPRTVEVPPLTFREVGALFPGYAARDRLMAWALFGGLARHLRPLDRDVTLATNVRQALLAHGAPLLLEGTERLQQGLQSVGRYASLLRSMAEGRAEWGEILAGAPELGGGAKMAPYLAKLQQLGIVTGEASLDARPGARNRRYRVEDPFLLTWFRFVLPNLTDLLDGRTGEVWKGRIRPQLDAHAAALFPRAAREYVARYADERLPGTAREVGGIWGGDYDMDPAGTLRSGAAFYGRAQWGRGRVPEAADDRLQEEVRRTRYGFGKEARLRVFFATDGFSSGLLRRAARTDALRLIGLEEMLRLPGRGTGG